MPGADKQSSSDYVWSLLAKSTTGLIWLTLLHGNALNPANEVPSSQDALPAPATEHIWVHGAAGGVWVPGAHYAWVIAHGALG